MSDAVIEAAAMALAQGEAVALTGAGISAPSGVPTFRGDDPGALWNRFDPMRVASIEGFLADPEYAWRALLEMARGLAEARPNAGHLALARLEALGRLRCIITQNIDGMHQRAGSREVIEFHGGLGRLVCTGCGRSYPLDQVQIIDLPPQCLCGGILKPDMVFFGESIPREALYRSFLEAERCRLMLVVGTSAQVEPAVSLPDRALAAGARVLEVNPEPTPLTSRATWSLRQPAEEVLPLLVLRVESLLSCP